MPDALSHFPFSSFVLGGPWGLAVGFIAPLVRSVLFGMPPMFPIAIAMAFELAAYGLVSGVLWRKVKHTVPMMYASLVTAMVAGRLVWGAVRFVLAGLTGSSFPFSAFLSGALLTAVPGIVAQLVLIPLILIALQKAKFIVFIFFFPFLQRRRPLPAAEEEPLGSACWVRVPPKARSRHRAATRISSAEILFLLLPRTPSVTASPARQLPHGGSLT